MREISLEARDIWFAYEGGEPVLNGISVTIDRGDFVAVIGQNGSGKTTLVKHFNGLLRPMRGQVLLDGRDIRDMSVGVLARSVGYAFQNPDHQIFSATTRDEIAFGPTNLGMGKAKVQEITDGALELFGLTQFADRQPATLGFGLRRKISIAAVYAMQTPFLVLDEPTTGLDRKSITELMSLVRELNQQGRTVILVTHDMRIVAEYAPRCMVVRDGEVVALDFTRTIFEQVGLLRSTHIEMPQISQLGRRMVQHGLRDGVLTVSEFCQAYSDLVAQ